MTICSLCGSAPYGRKSPRVRTTQKARQPRGQTPLLKLASDKRMRSARGPSKFAADAMRNTDAMVAFYKALGCDVKETAIACSVYFGDNMINFQRPARWQDRAFTNRAPAAVPSGGAARRCLGIKRSARRSTGAISSKQMGRAIGRTPPQPKDEISGNTKLPGGVGARFATATLQS
jgi:hypothetical protein